MKWEKERRNEDISKQMVYDLLECHYAKVVNGIVDAAEMVTMAALIVIESETVSRRRKQRKLAAE